MSETSTPVPAFDVDGRTFHIKPMPFKWHRLFRKYALPIFGAQYRPFEVLLVALTTARGESESELGFTRSVVDAEIDIDALLPDAAAVVCASQDEDTKDKAALIAAWAGKCEELTHDRLSWVVEQQAKLNGDLENLEESLVARFKQLLSLGGEKFDFVSRLLSPKPPSTSSAD